MDTILPGKVAPEVRAVFSLLAQKHTPTMLEQLSEYTPFQLLIATLLSARTKDATTIPIVQRLFRQYPAPLDFVKAEASNLEKALYGIGFYRVKSRHIQQLSAILLEKYKGVVPNTFEDLTSLPGVGRKTANCMLSYAFRQPAIAVDTHVHRISNRLGWIRTSSPEETEEALKQMLPKALWSEVNRLLVSHGQNTCLPIRPRCSSCPLQQSCVYGKDVLRNKVYK